MSELRSADPVLLPEWKTGPWTSSHIVRWCAAQQNWDKIHYDQDFSARSQGLQQPVINGALKQQLVMEYLGRDERSWWPGSLAVRFQNPDFIGDALAISGAATTVAVGQGYELREVDVQVRNLDRGHVSVTAHAQVAVSTGVTRVLDSRDELPHDVQFSRAVNTEIDQDSDERFRSRLGRATDRGESCVPVSRSRARLFVDALMLDMPEYLNYSRDSEVDPKLPFLFPLHGIEAAPGSLPLSFAPDAFGREGVAEVGKNLAHSLDVDQTRILNGGVRVDVFSRARFGEFIVAESRLVSVRERAGKRSGKMIVAEAVNTYTTESGRLLLVERPTVILR